MPHTLRHNSSTSSFRSKKAETAKPVITAVFNEIRNKKAMLEANYSWWLIAGAASIEARETELVQYLRVARGLEWTVNGDEWRGGGGVKSEGSCGRLGRGAWKGESIRKPTTRCEEHHEEPHLLTTESVRSCDTSSRDPRASFFFVCSACLDWRMRARVVSELLS